jgi:hypothetical protein
VTSLTGVRPLLERVLDAQEERPSACLWLVAGGGALHGLALGATSGEPVLAVYSAVKVPVLLLLSSVITLPTFYVLHAVLGLRDDFRAACHGLWGAQAAMGITLGALAPVVAFLAVSVVDPYFLTLADGALFAAAVWVGQVVLRRHYRVLLARDRRHRVTLTCWAVLYVFFAIQLAWVLRPFLGTPGYPVEFLRASAFEQNAYVVLVEHVVKLLRP